MMTGYEVFYNNWYRYPDYAVWCEGKYPTLEEAKNHKPWYRSSVFERIDRVEYDADGFVINCERGIS
jgi:hypothetical protein